MIVPKSFLEFISTDIIDFFAMCVENEDILRYLLYTYSLHIPSAKNWMFLLRRQCVASFLSIYTSFGICNDQEEFGPF